MTDRRRPDLLLFNLATDEDDPILGFTVSWINALAAYCASIDVVTMRAGRRETASNVRVFSIGKERGFSKPHRAIEFYRILTRLLSGKRYDACFCHMTPLFAVMAAPLLRARHVRLTLWYAHKAIPLSLRVAERVVDVVVTPTPESFPLRSAKVQVVGHGIDTAKFTAAPASPAEQRPFTIACIGRVAPIKRLEILIQAVGLLVQGDGARDLRLRIVGPTAPKDAAYARHLQDWVAALDLTQRIAFAGPVPYGAIADEYHQADLLVSTSQTGSADKVVLEAMACEVPAVTSNPGLASTLAPWAEMLLERSNSAEGLAVKIRNLIDLPPSERMRLGQELRRQVEEHHSLDRLARRLAFEVF